MLRHGSGSLLLGRDDHGEASALSRAVAGIRIADIPHGNLHVRKGANSSSLCSYQFASIATANAWFLLHANGTTNTPSNANAANIAHASLTLQTKAAFSIIGRTNASAFGVSGPDIPLANNLGSNPIAVAVVMSPARSRARRAAAWMLVRPYRTVSISAMPIAPPRLRMRLKRPLASGTCASDSAPNAKRVGGNRQNMIAVPRMTCGQNIPLKSVSRVWNVLSPNPSVNRAKPTPVSNLASRRRSSATAIGAIAS